ncbi:MAG TPA: preQ(1) synthase [Spirochaetia bacterium]|nr:preQ(1) synthase [Spirochaetia bacterium]
MAKQKRSAVESEVRATVSSVRESTEPKRRKLPGKPLEAGGYTDEHAQSGVSEPLPELECFPNQYPGANYTVEITFPEFDSVCPKTGLPDSGTVSIEYVPNKVCVELKSLKLYYLAYRNLGIFSENVVNRVFEDLQKALKPRKLKVRGEFSARGGIYTNVEREI